MNSIVTPFFADLMLWLMYIMIGAALLVSGYSVWHGLRTRRKGDDIINGVPAGRIGWCVAIGFVLLLVVTFLLGSSKPIVTNGERFTNVFWLKTTDMFIYTSILLIIGCFVSAIVVTSSMDTEKGLLRQMAPPPQEQTEPKDVNKDHVLQVELDGHDQLTCNGKTVDYRALAEEVRTMATINREGHIITIKTDPETSYEAYFGMQNAIAGAYASLRQDYALKHFGKRYADCDAEQRALLNEYYPQRISEDLKGGDR